MKKIVEVKELTKEYKNLKAVNNLSFEVEKGEILGLLGPNGSGKSTTINCILALLNYQKGLIKIFDKPMTPEAYDIKRKIGVIFQDVAVFDELNVYDNIDYFCGLYISDKQTRKKYVNDAIKLVGLEDFEKFLPKQLSGGLLRRLNIACGIAHKPELIILDEPTLNVEILCTYFSSKSVTSTVTFSSIFARRFNSSIVPCAITLPLSNIIILSQSISTSSM